jgi:hypothetical protein
MHLEARLCGRAVYEAPAIEASVAADPERGQPSALQLAVNRYRRNPEVIRQFPYGHYAAVVWFHFTDLRDFLTRERALLSRVRAADFEAT